MNLEEIREKLAVRFQTLPPELAERIDTVFQDVDSGVMDPIRLTQLHFEYFFKRVELMCDDGALATVQEGGQGRVVGIVIPGFTEATLHIDTIPEIRITPGVKPKDPELIFADWQLVKDIFTAKAFLVEAFLTGKLRIRNLPDVLKWFAPIAAVQTVQAVEQARVADLALLDEMLRSEGY